LATTSSTTSRIKTTSCSNVRSWTSPYSTTTSTAKTKNCTCMRTTTTTSTSKPWWCLSYSSICGWSSNINLNTITTRISISRPRFIILTTTLLSCSTTTCSIIGGGWGKTTILSLSESCAYTSSSRNWSWCIWIISITLNSTTSAWKSIWLSTTWSTRQTRTIISSTSSSSTTMTGYSGKNRIGSINTIISSSSTSITSTTNSYSIRTWRGWNCNRWIICWEWMSCQVSS